MLFIAHQTSNTITQLCWSGYVPRPQRFKLHNILMLATFKTFRTEFQNPSRSSWTGYLPRPTLISQDRQNI